MIEKYEEKDHDRQTAENDGSSNYEISGIIIFCFGIFTFISLFSQSTGMMGKWVSDGIHFLFGLGAPAAALFLVLFGLKYALAARGIAMSRRNGLLFAYSFFSSALCITTMSPLEKKWKFLKSFPTAAWPAVD